jgi:D-alanine-D-alanine ligase
MRAVLLVDDSFFDRDDPNFSSKHRPKHAAAEFSVSDALRSLGHEVVGIPATVDIAETINNIKAAKPSFVFNMVEEIGGCREYDNLVVHALELMNIPFTGASSDVLALARNKHLSKLVVADAGVAVPRGIVISSDLRFSSNDVHFPAIIKPMYLDGSEGVTANSYVADSGTLRRRIARLSRWLPILCEEYVPGRELIVTMSGTRTPSIDSICEMVFPEASPIRFATERAKFDANYRGRFGIVFKTPTHLPRLMRDRVVKAAVAAYKALGINAYAKLEFRVCGERVVFIEANPNSQMSRFAKTTDFASIGYERFIRKIIRMALARRSR